jgi:hypothetical protein
MTIQPLAIGAPQPIDNSFDFSQLAKLGQIANPQNNTLANLGSQYGSLPPFPSGGASPVPYSGADNSKSWYDFAVRPVDQGGLGLSPVQATGVVSNLQAESGAGIPSWGPTGDQGTAHGAAQWREERLAALQKYASDRGLDYRSTEAQQGFMRNEYLNSERGAYDRLLAAQTPQQAAGVVNRYYERSADRTGTREAAAARLARRFGLLVGGQ